MIHEVTDRFESLMGTLDSSDTPPAKGAHTDCYQHAPSSPQPQRSRKPGASGRHWLVWLSVPFCFLHPVRFALLGFRAHAVAWFHGSQDRRLSVGKRGLSEGP
ncbi:unnamed protein product [Rangifer tarandus platyrhynchus]|uniref:Uncharacterized protein n=2 Tax=Rangifer tarandus platyrhynchus TaxID=3082113 RepID=A0ABN8Z808_RANTA|nr:unnamed protein product [Rangifer tarandus platyrhynchus]